MVINSKRLIIAPLRIEDAYEMKNWGLHDNPLFEDYNFPFERDEEVKKWFRYKTYTIKNKYYSVKDKNSKLVGYLGIKNRSFIRKSSFLGIVFDPNNINKGFGTESLIAFLDYYFNRLRMKVIYLEVAEFNHRALKVYEKLGFKKIGYYLDYFPFQEIDVTHKDFIEAKSYFVIDGEKIYNYIYKMKLDKEGFLALRKGDEG